MSGAELHGATVTVEFDDGTELTNDVSLTPGSATGAAAVLSGGTPPAPGLTRAGGASAPATVTSPAQSVVVTGPPGAQGTVVVAEGHLEVAQAPGGGTDLDPFEANTVVAIDEVPFTLGGNGSVSVPVTLTSTDDPTAADTGLNHVTAYLVDGGTRGAVSDPVVMDLDPPPGGSGAYLASDGQVVIEAESADQAIARSGQSWAPGGPAGAVGGAVTLAPDSGQGYSAAEAPTQAPELVFDVDFDQAGTWMVHVRGNPADTAGNSIHMGLDGQVQSSADNISAGGFGTWGWFNWTSGGPSAAFLNVPTPGVHTVHVWGREDGMSLDRIVLQTQGAAPSGDGPPESARSGA